MLSSDWVSGYGRAPRSSLHLRYSAQVIGAEICHFALEPPGFDAKRCWRYRFYLSRRDRRTSATGSNRRSALLNSTAMAVRSVDPADSGRDVLGLSEADQLTAFLLAIVEGHPLAFESRNLIGDALVSD